MTMPVAPTKPRVLLVAEAANPRMTSVPLVGWSHSRAIAARVDAHLVTQIRNRDAVLDAGLVEGRDFTAIDSEAVARRVYKLAGLMGTKGGRGWTTLMALSSVSYAHFEKLIWRRFGADIRAGRFDIVHRLTPLSPTIPSSLAGRCAKAGVPFVLGPLNGGAPWPAAFDVARRWEREWLTYVRGAYKLVPGYRATRRHSAAILIGSQHTWRQMPDRYRARCVYLPENAIDPDRFSKRRSGPYARPLRAIFIGRLVPYKGCDMAIDAAAELLRSGAMQLTIVGDGPQRGELEAQVVRLGVGPAVTFRGKLPHEQVQDALAESDVLTFPSIREFGGGVVVEAMAVGVVPIVVDYAGPAEIVTPRTGHLIPLGTRAEIVDRLRVCLEGLVTSPQPLEAMSQRGIERVHTLFTWPVRAAQVERVYAWVLGRADKPDFGMPLSAAAEAVG